MIEMTEERLMFFERIRKHNPNSKINQVILLINDLEKFFPYEMENYYRNYEIFNGFYSEKVYFLDYFDNSSFSNNNNDKKFIRKNAYEKYGVEMLNV